MKFLCTKDNLITGLSAVVHIASRNSSLPILNNILLKTSKIGLEISATNLEVAIKTVVRGKVEQEGAIVVQGKLIFDWVVLAASEKIEIEADGTNLNLLAGKRKAIIRGVAAEEFPVIPEIESGLSFSANNQELTKALSGVALAVNNDESRPEISGIFLKKQNHVLFFVGTDSYRLAEAKITTTNEQDVQTIVPLRTIQELVRIAASNNEETTVFVSDNQILFVIGDTKITSRVIAGQYPDYQQIIPQQHNTKLVVETNQLIQAVKAASLFVRSGINDVKLIYSSITKELTVASNNAQVGEGATELSLINSEGETVEIVFNYRYLLDGLTVMATDQTEIKINNSTTPAVLTPIKQTDYFYIIMPIRQ